MNCPKCNNKYNQGDMFCKFCGIKLTEQNPKGKTWSVFLILGICLVLIVTLVLSCVWMNGGFKSKKVALDTSKDVDVETYDDGVDEDIVEINNEKKEDTEESTEEPFDGDYEKLIQKLLSQEPVKDLAEQEEIYELANAAAQSYIISSNESKNMQDLTEDEARFLLFELIVDMKLYKTTKSIHVDFLKEKNEGPFYIELDKEGLNHLVRDYIGNDRLEKDFWLDEVYFRDAGNGWTSVQMGDGEAVTELGDYDIYEDEKFYLIKAPVYSYNDAVEARLSYDKAFIAVFEKTPDSQLCGRLVYINAKEDF